MRYEDDPIDTGGGAGRPPPEDNRPGNDEWLPGETRPMPEGQPLQPGERRENRGVKAAVPQKRRSCGSPGAL